MVEAFQPRLLKQVPLILPLSPLKHLRYFLPDLLVALYHPCIPCFSAYRPLLLSHLRQIHCRPYLLGQVVEAVFH
jgi:hypothetical protein